MTVPDSRPSLVHVWWLAIRPKTLTVSFAPVLVGTALAWAEAAVFQWLPALVAVLCAGLIQVGTNLHNDVKDYERGADTPERLGPARATASGWLTAGQVKRAVAWCFGAAVLLGVYLVWHGGWGILLIGLASVVTGLAYTGGPKPIAYSATGELFVWLFFGLTAVLGSFYLQAFHLDLAAFAAANMVGFFAAAVIVVNNTRDYDTDRKVGKNTLAVRIGRRWSVAEYGALVLAPFALLALLPGQGGWLPLAALPWALALIRRLRAEASGPGYNRLLAQTAQLQLLFSVLLSVGVNL
ncbi:MAG: 1,4-dihydroxy-2-naphthoate polyprenyltransferase [Sulfuricella sp.]|nr:1,4-dihydroxy-2-naphthoate polyprenyltransferase [Sulfuricella sp.]